MAIQQAYPSRFHSHHSLTHLVKWIALSEGVIALNTDVWELQKFYMLNYLLFSLAYVKLTLKVTMQLSVTQTPLLALSLIENGVPNVHKYASIIPDIQTLLRAPWDVSFKHTLREGNQSADHLAKFGVSSSEELVVLDDPPLAYPPADG
ncbi:Reverse transcriptase-like [Sesbania bispinosa]|nr:Reverse transcriptase-like [Sesbania bispinosa]